MQENKNKYYDIAERIYDLDGEVYECVGSSLGRTFTGDKRTCVNNLVMLMRTKPQGHLLRSELALISNMARTIRKDFGLYLLSNASTRIDEQLGHCPAYPLMDGRMVSAEERLMKPDPAIYQLLCERYGLDPATCIFVDDNLNNCHGAEVAGMQSFHFITDDAAASVAQLERILDL